MLQFINQRRKLAMGCSVLLLASITAGFAQGTRADYRRADAVDTLYRKKVWNVPAAFHWLPDGEMCWYLNTTAAGKQFVLINAHTQTRTEAFDHARVATLLSEALHHTVEPGALPFETIDFDEDQKNLIFKIDTTEWRVALANYQFETKKWEEHSSHHRYWGGFDDEREGREQSSPNGKWSACVKEFNVFIKDLATKEEIQLSYDGTEGEYYAARLQWSPDSKKLMAYKIRPGQDRQIFFVESSPADQLQPKLHYRDYRKPGDALPERKPQLFLIDNKKQITIEETLFKHAYTINNFSWRKDSRAFTFEYNARGHQQYRVLSVDAQTGNVRVLIDEQSKTFIDYSSKKYRYDVADGAEILWTSERDGWNHLYRFDGKTGKLINQITRGAWVVRDVLYVDEAAHQIIFAFSGMDEGQDPYLVHYARIGFNGKGFTRLTREEANHHATFSSNHQYFIDQYSRVDLPPVSVLRRARDGQVLMTLEEANIQALKQTGWTPPEVFHAKGRDQQTDIWGMIIRPSNFTPDKQYPVIEYIYAGPHSAHVPKDFHAYYWAMHSLAELGFVVVQIDGMGTSHRSKAFHDVCWQNLKDAGFPDRIAWIKAAAAQYPYLDTTRVGIHGVSAGGQNAAAALIFHPGFYSVAVSSCGCHDNRMDKIWWNEQWMGYPIGQQYEACSNVVHAAEMEGKLMLILGEMDDNVDPATTMQLVDALIKARKDHTLVVVPGMGHSAGGEYGERKRRDFFVTHLMGMVPPNWEEVYLETGMVN